MPLDSFGGDPLNAAAALAAAGARWLHVVDMDLAYEGRARNLGVVSGVARMPVRVQVAGGVESRADAEALLEAGATRVVLGSAALADRALVESAIVDLGEALAIGMETEGGRVRPRGRRTGEVDLGLGETLEWVAGAGAARVVLTDVARVGAGGGPDLEAVGSVARAAGCPVIVSGGIATEAHLWGLADIEGVEGGIVGRALYEGGLDLRDLLTRDWEGP